MASIIVTNQLFSFNCSEVKVGIPENRDTGPQKNRKTGTLVGSQQKPRKTGKPGPQQESRKTGLGTPVGHQQDPTKTGKPGPATLEKPESRDLSGTLRKPKKWDVVPQWPPKTGKADPNVTLEKLYNCKPTFIYLLFPCTKGGRTQRTKNFKNFLFFFLCEHNGSKTLKTRKRFNFI